MSAAVKNLKDDNGLQSLCRLWTRLHGCRWSQNCSMRCHVTNALNHGVLCGCITEVDGDDSD
jgi:hypothetical protein